MGYFIGVRRDLAPETESEPFASASSLVYQSAHPADLSLSWSFYIRRSCVVIPFTWEKGRLSTVGLTPRGPASASREDGPIVTCALLSSAPAETTYQHALGRRASERMNKYIRKHSFECHTVDKASHA